MEPDAYVTPGQLAGSGVISATIPTDYEGSPPTFNMLTDATLTFDLPTPVIDPIESSHTVDTWQLYDRADATSVPLSNTKVEQNKLVYSIGKIPNN